MSPAAIKVLTVVCRIVLDSDGNRAKGCGRGWTTTNRTEACPGCGELPAVIDVHYEQALATHTGREHG